MFGGGEFVIEMISSQLRNRKERNEFYWHILKANEEMSYMNW